MTRRQLLISLLLTAVAFAIAPRVYAQEETAAPPSADEQLLEGLGDDLLDGLDDLIDNLPAEQDNGSGAASEPTILEQGEDLGAASEDELTKIGRQMRQVESQLARGDISSETDKSQQQIVEKLDAIIRQLQEQQKQCSATASSSSPPPQRPAEDLQQPKPPNQGQRQPSTQPARDSEELTDAHAAKATDHEAVASLIKKVWGHLPDRLRQEMQSAVDEEFLPQYEELTEDYFRRLAEEGSAP